MNNNILIDYDEIVDVFSYDDYLDSNIKFINQYNNLIEKWLDNHRLNSEQLFNYMLVGFYFDYQTSIHHGNSFNTKEPAFENLKNNLKEVDQIIHDVFNVTIEKYDNKENDIIEKRLKAFIVKCKLFNKYYSKSIESTTEYLGLLKINDGINIDGDYLFNFVINN